MVVWAEEGMVSEILLAVFVLSILVTWALAILVDTRALEDTSAAGDDAVRGPVASISRAPLRGPGALAGSPGP